MSLLGRMLGTAIYALFAPVRLLTRALPSKWNLQLEMRRTQSLAFECTNDAILIKPLRKRHQGQRGAAAIARALRHIQTSIAFVQPYTGSEQERSRELTERDLIGEGHLIYKLPVELPRCSPYYDGSAWEALRRKIAAIAGPISLSDLEGLEIEAYVETRPPGFDSTEYYMSYR